MLRFRGLLHRAGVWLVAASAIVLAPMPAQSAKSTALPTRPLPADMVEGFGEGKVLAFHYRLSYACLTTPASDVDGPYGRGDGFKEAKDPSEYQLPPCFFGDTGTGSIPPIGPDGRPFAEQRKLYAIVPAFSVPDLYAANTAAGSVDTQCARPGRPVTVITDAPGTCLMHPSLLHTPVADPPTGSLPDPVPLPQHSHVIEGTSSAATWWNAVGIDVTDASVWPDNDGHCAAGPPRCLTSLRAIRDAQRAGLATPDNPSNVFFYFSAQVEGVQPGDQRAAALKSESSWRCVLPSLRLF